MTQDEIIEMWNSVIKYAPSEVRITEFAKLVAAKAFQNGYEKGIAGFNEAVSLEREACAKVIEAESHMFATLDAAKSLANGIRARGEAYAMVCKVCGYTGTKTGSTGQCPRCDWDALSPIGERVQHLRLHPLPQPSEPEVKHD